ncbi:hypothetical protein B0182_04055 [Moraxella bovis]|nr:hypothetical protein DQF64_10485 [Moraxella bovis]OOR90964.1 hypothetical protein B0182_04055 [Moraxella bovis]
MEKIAILSTLLEKITQHDTDLHEQDGENQRTSPPVFFKMHPQNLTKLSKLFKNHPVSLIP